MIPVRLGKTSSGHSEFPTQARLGLSARSNRCDGVLASLPKPSVALEHERELAVHQFESSVSVRHGQSDALLVYSDIGGSSIVGGQVTDLLRKVQYKRQGRGTVYFEPLHIQYIPLRNEVVDRIESQIAKTDGRLVQFAGPTPTILTLHFKRDL